MTSLLRALTGNQPLPEGGIPQNDLENPLTLGKNFLAMGNEQQGLDLVVPAQPAEIECGNPCLSRSRGGDHEISKMTPPSFGFKGFKNRFLVRFGNGIDVERDTRRATALFLQRTIKTPAVAFRVIRLELGFFPVLLEGRLKLPDHLRISDGTDPHVPLEAVHLGRVREVRGSDVGGMETTLSAEKPRLGMEAGAVNIEGDLHVSPEFVKRIESPAFRRSRVDRGDDAHRHTGCNPLLEFPVKKPQSRVADKGTKKVDAVGARYLADDLTGDLHVTPAVDEKTRVAQGPYRSFRCHR